MSLLKAFNSTECTKFYPAQASANPIVPFHRSMCGLQSLTRHVNTAISSRSDLTQHAPAQVGGKEGSWTPKPPFAYATVYRCYLFEA